MDTDLLMEKLNILAAAAKYDVACTSSGSQRRGKKGFLGNAVSAGVCHSFSSDGRCISLLKILMSNDCIFDCKYCANRASNDVPRATFTPEEICRLVTEFYRRNYIEGLFLSSGILHSPDYTMEKMYETIYMLRNRFRFNGYIHVKAIPGASDDRILQLGYLVDRMSVNLELPTFEGLKALAPNKKPTNLIRPMQTIRNQIVRHRLAVGKEEKMERFHGNRYLEHSIFHSPAPTLSGKSASLLPGGPSASSLPRSGASGRRQARGEAAFVPAGQSTQMIVGATRENDLQLLRLTQRLYQQFDLKRVFFSAYVPVNEDSALPAPGTPPPLLREHRLYQADWLLRYYGFQADELLSEEKPNFNPLLDPKCDWALRNLKYFPVEINAASYEELLRVPGIGVKSAGRIVRSRRLGSLDFPHLKKMGVVLKRAAYFITCRGKMLYHVPIEEKAITRRLIEVQHKKNWEIAHPDACRQLSLFDDFHIRSDTEIVG